jgi:hypothetical protein
MTTARMTKRVLAAAALCLALIACTPGATPGRASGSVSAAMTTAAQPPESPVTEPSVSARPTTPTAAIEPTTATPPPETEPSGGLGTSRRPSAGPTTLTGFPEPGVEANCWLLNGYQLIGTPPELLISGRAIAVTGHVEPGVLTPCQQGVPFRVETAVTAP